MAGSIVGLILVAAAVGTTLGILLTRDKGGSGSDTPSDRYKREKDPTFWYQKAKDELKTVLDTKLQRGVAKNVILFLGDGMGLPSVTAGRILAGQLTGLDGEEFTLAFDHFPTTGLSKTYNVNTQTTDSAASGTAYLTGVKTNQGMLGLSAKAKRGDCQSGKGNEVDSILKWFHQAGRPTGIVTTTRITHASPGAAYGNTVERNWESDADIPKDQRTPDCPDNALQLIASNSYINVIMGGGRRNFKPNITSSNSSTGSPQDRRLDGRDLIKEWNDKLRKVPHAYVTNRDELMQADESSQHLLGLFSESHMDFEVDRDKTKQPSLAEMTSKAIKLLQARTQGSNGFFLFVEGGRIDHGHHESKAVKAIHEVVSFSQAVQTAVDMTNIADTLIVVTADHSHSMGISGYPKRGNPIFGLASLDKDILNEYLLDKLPWTTLEYLTGPGYEAPRKNLTDVKTDDKNYVFQAAIPITEATHAAEDVAIYARGPQSFLYNGVHEQNYIPMLMAYASCVGPFAEGKAQCARKQSNDLKFDDNTD